ncbi:MAG: nucleotidyltransferase family protein [Anaerolineales bacterium]|nr:nucleotidyltransferase family protein [Anaerolineales bacterium]
MKLSSTLKSQIKSFSTRWQVTEFALFGSFVKGQMHTDSDVDVLVTFSPDAHPTLFDLVKMQMELETLFGRPVDLVERKGLEQSQNYLRRKDILNSLETVFLTN